VDHRLLSARAGENQCLLGNEAVVRGALEAGVAFVSGYPGTPASEIGDTFARLHEEAGVIFEWSVNEKIALETAFGAATAGARSLCYMKHLGLAYAGDPLGTIPYIGVEAGMVIVSAGDPGMVISPNEQDQRHLGRMHRLPVLEPATPAEASTMTRTAFELSEESGLPVILRTTPQVGHVRGVVPIGSVRPRAAAPAFRRRPAELTPIPVNARRMRAELDERLARAEAWLARSPFFPRFGNGPLGVLAAGPPINLVLDHAEESALATRLTILAAGATHPLPRIVLEDFLGRVDRILVVEELTPFLEGELRALAHQVRPSVTILGKGTGHLPGRYAYSTDLVRAALLEFAGAPAEAATAAVSATVPPRPPVLCPGCPHRGSYLAARTVFGDDGIYLNDIGCYTLGYGPPLESVDALLAMGSCIPMASAMSRVLGRKTLAFIGDSTFFHSGMPGLLNAAAADDDVVVMILDNRVTAMTGHQPSPTSPGAVGPDLEAVVRAIGAKRVAVVDPHDLGASARALLDAKRQRGLSVVIARRDCAIVRFREEGTKPRRRKFAVDPTRCRHCGHEAKGLHCGQGPLKEVERAQVFRRILNQAPGTEPIPTPVPLEAPCAVACPANICVQGYVGRIAAGRFAEALALIRVRNPLPVVSSRVCHRPCEQVCTRAATDGPIAINDLKRFLVDEEMAGRVVAPPVSVGPPTGRRVAVVGAGPSGLACAHELRRRGHAVTVFDEHHEPGGLLAQGIPEHRLPRDVLRHEIAFVLGHGIEFRGGVRLGRDTTVAALRGEGFDAVYLGIGAMKGLAFGVPGSELPGTLDALDFLRHHHRGERCTVPERVLVVGGGDAAVDAARTMLRLGARQVSIVYRRSREEMPAHRQEVDAAEAEGISILTHRQPVRVLGDDRVRGLEVLRTEPGAPDGSGRRRPVPVPGSGTVLPADAVVAAIGQRPESDGLDAALDRDDEGHVRVDPATGATNLPGIFAGGDVTPGPKTVIHAIAAGRRAAFGIDLLIARAGTPVEPVETIDARNLSYFVPRSLLPEPGHRAGLRPAAERRADHADVVTPLTKAEAREEAARCLLCAMCSSCAACTDIFGCPALREENGRMTIDGSLCTGCGVCVSFCPNGAIHEVTTP
jgi:indolepyruvate ferredoxin oxidoreductase alpha subunit